jgi:UDP-glucose-4-epimerase GalE
VVRALLGDGRRVVVLDDLSAGNPGAVPVEVPLVRASVTDAAAVRRALDRYAVTGVIHLAGRKSVPESLARPLTYYQQNVGGTLALLEAMTDVGVGQIVLSSSAAVYGAPGGDLVSEDAAPEPLNPYGASKLVCEWLVADAARVHGLRHLILRYFNVAGATMVGPPCPPGIGLLACAVDAVARGARPVVFGRDYPTPDGSCVRDFVHVLDVASAHALAADALEAGFGTGVYNIGCGIGYSVEQVLDRIRQVTGVGFEEETRARRSGDPARVVASIDNIRRELGWRPRYGLTEMVRSQWEAHLGTVRHARPSGAGRRRYHPPPPVPEPATAVPDSADHQTRPPTGRPARIVVLSASIGAGHDGAAGELAARLAQRDFQVDQMDLVSVFPRRLGVFLRSRYRGMLTRHQWIYKILFRIACTFDGAAPITRALLRPMRQRLLRVLPPDTCAVVSTYPLGAQILGPLRQSGRLAVPVINYLTDFAVHPIWVAPGIDVHCAAHEVSRAQARDLGAGDTRLAGRLVPASFRPASDGTKRQARQRLGLPSPARLALLVAGSWGVGQVEATVAEVAGSGAAIPVVVCGRNTTLYRRLRRQGVAHVFGWVDDMLSLLQSVDVLVENAGGLTALEAMACGVPVATYRPIAGHGTANAASMAQAGVARWIRAPEALGPALVELIEGGPGQHQRQAGLALFESDPATVVADFAKAGSSERRDNHGDRSVG